MYWAAAINVFILGPLCCVPLYFLSSFVTAVKKEGGGAPAILFVYSHMYTHILATHTDVYAHTCLEAYGLSFLSLFHNGGLLSMLRNSSPGILVFGINSVM